MTAVSLETPALGVGPLLDVARTDITFADVAPGRVHIAVTVWNRGEVRSAPADALLMAAPLGAFVPWRPLAVLPVPALEPGEPIVLETEVSRPATRPLGPPDRVAPRRLLTALGAEDDRPGPDRSGAAGFLALFRRLRSRHGSAARALPLSGLPADPLELLGHGGAHWAGNLNVFVDRKPVERHLAQALRIYPGQVNLAMFVVGSGHRDAYRFELAGEGAGWDAVLHDMTTLHSLAFDRGSAAPVTEGGWVSVDGQRLMFLALRPPADCAAGTVEVRVEQRSTGQTAVVEFSLDPRAAGPGCYVV
jgi:hypothetical protein